MKIKILSCLFFLLLSLNLPAQTWMKVQEGTLTSFVERMSFINSTTGFATYAENTGGIVYVLKTTDAGNNWTKIVTSCSNALYDVKFLNSTTGYVASFNGEIGKSTNGGTNWTEVYQNGSNFSLYAMNFFDANTGFACGQNYMVRTTNAGGSWSAVGSVTNIIYSSAVFSATNAVICGTTGTDGVVYLTTNSGSSWAMSTISPGNTLYDVFFLDANTGFVSGNAGSIFKTTNGGGSWSPLTTGASTALSAVYFQNANTGFVAGSAGSIFKTTNGGTSFTPIVAAPLVNQSNYDFHFFDANNGILSGSSGAFYQTSDGGNSWVMSKSNIIVQLNAVNFVTSSTGFAAGIGGAVEKSTDGGLTWQILTNIPVSANFTCMDFPTASTGYVAGASGSMVKTTDAGATWSTLTTGIASQIASIDFIDANTGYLTAPTGVMRKSTDGGGSWNAVTTGLATNLTGVSFPSANTGFVTSTGGNMRKTTNAGTNWSALTTGTANLLNAVTFVDDNTGYAVGASGTIIKTTNGGTNWSTQTSGTTNSLAAVRFGNGTNGIAVGTAGTILVTTNGGTNWAAQTSNTTVALRSAFIQPNGNVVVVGGTGNILYSNDQVLPVELASFTSTVHNNRDVKLNWQTVTEMNNSGFEIERTLKSENEQWNKIGFVTGNGTTNNQNIYVYEDKNLSSGSYKYRLKQIDFNGNYEYKNLSNEVIIGKPNSFELSQNYPNPFNPSTKIVFSLPFDSKVTLKIFDITGKEIRTLLNEFKSADFYVVDFNAGELPSGIYFCKISAQSDSKDFAKTIKMILSK